MLTGIFVFGWKAPKQEPSFSMNGKAGVVFRETVIESNPYRTALSPDQVRTPLVPAAAKPLVRLVLVHANRTMSPDQAVVCVPKPAASTKSR